MKKSFLSMWYCIALFATACGESSTEPSAAIPKLSSDEAQSIARDAYIYGFPLVMNLKTIYDYTVDVESPNYKGPLNEVACEARLFTPADTAIVTPNSDTPYCMFWMDLRSEPQVLTVPEIEDNRYYGVQLIDFLTHNFAYIGTRVNDNIAGNYLLAGPGWSGDKPADISDILTSETDLIFAIVRTQLFDSDDLDRVAEIQATHALQPLSEFLGQDTAQQAPAIAVPKWTNGGEYSVAAYDYLDFALDLLAAHPDENELLARFAKLGIGTADTFNTDALEPEILAALEAGVQQGISDMRVFLDHESHDPLASARLFGTREFLIETAAAMGQPTFYLQRAVGALAGLYGNSGEEAVYPAYFVDHDGDQLNSADSKYMMRFAAGDLPPVGAFWSLSMYDGVTQLFIENPLDRYLVNSGMTDSFVFEDDGSLVIQIQKDSPGTDREANWLPAPDGTFYIVLRLYLPDESVLNGEWTAPKLVKTN